MRNLSIAGKINVLKTCNIKKVHLGRFRASSYSPLDVLNTSLFEEFLDNMSLIILGNWLIICGGWLEFLFMYNNVSFVFFYGFKLFSSLIKCSISFKIERFNWIMVKIQLSFKYSEFHVNYFTIFSLITTLSTDVTKSLQYKDILLSDVTWRHVWR